MLHIFIDNTDTIDIGSIRAKIDSLDKASLINKYDVEHVLISHYNPEAENLIQIKNNCFVLSCNNYIDLKNIPLYVYFKCKKLIHNYKYILLDTVYLKDMEKYYKDFTFNKDIPIGYTFKKEILQDLGGYKAIDDLNILKSNIKEDNYLETSLYSLDMDYLIRYILYTEMKNISQETKNKFLQTDYGHEKLNELRDFIKETIQKINKSDVKEQPELFYYNKHSYGKCLADTYFIWLNTLYSRKVRKFCQYVILDKFMKNFKYLKNLDNKTKLARESYFKSILHVPIFPINSDYETVYNFINSKI